MTGRMKELREFRWGNDGFAAVALPAQFENGDGAAVAANAEQRIIAYVQA